MARMRITNKILEAKVKTLNRVLGRPETAWTKSGEKCTANVGNIHFSGQNGYTSLYVMANENGGVHSLYSGSKSAVADYIHAYMSGYLQAQEEHKERSQS